VRALQRAGYRIGVAGAMPGAARRVDDELTRIGNVFAAGADPVVRDHAAEAQQQSVAGHHTKAVEYLLGSHVIAESMSRYNPRTLRYAPLRVLIYSDADDNAAFSMDRPSAAFGSLGVEAITAVAEDLDRKVAALLRVLGVDAEAAFATA
jgi:hypothetical protein